MQEEIEQLRIRLSEVSAALAENSRNLENLTKLVDEIVGDVTELGSLMQEDGES